jgi:hypothetical protein
MDFTQAIATIQDEYCRNCRAGKALIVLKGLDEEPAIPEAIPEQSKACSKCGTLQPLDNYEKHANCPDGHTGICKKCKAAYAKALYAKRKAAAKQVAGDPLIAETRKVFADGAKEPKPKKTKPAKHGTTPDKEKPHACEACGKRFMSFGSLLEHRKYNCPMGEY